ncbi:MAG: Sensor histidine kinase RcsC [Thermoanaerobaculia bacterium]|nr:Sensor histidine kinase RcsC [Thermoanaerobaculia bacterium]
MGALLLALIPALAGAPSSFENDIKRCWDTAPSDPEAAIRVAEAAIPAAQRAGNAAAVAELRLCRGYGNEGAGRLATAEAEYEFAVSEAERLHDDRLTADALMLRGELHHSRGRFDAALADLQRAYRLDLTLRRDGKKHRALGAIANVYADANVGEYDKALEYYRLLLAENEKAGLAGDVATDHFNIGSTLDTKGDPQGALPELQKALEMERQRGDAVQIAYCERSVAIVLTKLGRAREALVPLFSALKAFEKAGDANMAAATRLSRGVALRQLGRPLEALRELDAARAHYLANSDDRFLLKIEGERAEASAALGDWRMAFEARSAQLDAERRLGERRKQEHASRLRVQFDTERKEEENRALLRENTLRTRVLVLSLCLLALAAYTVARKLAHARRLRRANEELADRNAVLAENIRLQEEVERVSRHDLRTPLANTIALMKQVRRTPGLSVRQVELMRLVERSCYRVMDLVNLSVDMLKMERGTYHLNARPVELVNLLRHVAGDLEGHAQSKNLRIELVNAHGGTCEPCWALGEELLCYSMFANLLKNAVEASPDGEAVAVAVSSDAAEVTVRVRNRGAVPMELRATFFDKFTTGGKRGGTGLGTYSARLMATTQGGRIAMTTSEEQGTTLEVVLPAAPPEVLSVPYTGPEDRRGLPELGVATAAPAIGRLEALIVDDDAIAAAMLQATLVSLGAGVSLAANGRAGLDAAERNPPDLVIVDMEMPVMNGPEMVRELRRRETFLGRRAFVTGLTAHEEFAELERFRSAGCDRCLVKPVEVEDVEQVVSEARALRVRRAAV